MSREVIDHAGDWQVVARDLTDKSCVYSVETDADSGERVELACYDQQHARELAYALNAGVVGVSILTTSPVGWASTDNVALPLDDLTTFAPGSE